MSKDLLNALLSHSSIHIVSHIRPDGDCLGAQFGLAAWLKALGIQVRCLNEDTVPDYLSFLPAYTQLNVETITQDKLQNAEAILVVDGNAPHRFGRVLDEWANNPSCPIYCLDHHPEPADIFTERYVDTSMSSSCEMVYKLISCHPAGFSYLNAGAAKSIYTGILTDTGSHAFDSVTSETLKASAHLMELGNFKPNEIHEALYSSRNLNEIRLLGLALNTLELHENGAIATIEVHEAFYEQTNTKPEDTEGIVNYALSVEGVKAALFLKDTTEGIKMSLRSKSALNVNEWAKQLNGGGHAKAAGAKMPGKLLDVKQQALAIGRVMLSELSSESA